MTVSTKVLRALGDRLSREGYPVSAENVYAAAAEIERLRAQNVGENERRHEPSWPASYDETFRAIGAAVTPYGDKQFGISVKAFYRALAYPERPAECGTGSPDPELPYATQ